MAMRYKDRAEDAEGLADERTRQRDEWQARAARAEAHRAEYVTHIARLNEDRNAAIERADKAERRCAEQDMILGGGGWWKDVAPLIEQIAAAFRKVAAQVHRLREVQA